MGSVSEGADPIDRRRGRDLFGRDVDAYERARPGYPARVYEVLAERCGLGPGTRVLEVGPGAGLATLPLLAAGASVTAVEPDARLAARLEANAAGGGDLAVVVDSIEHAELSAGAFDLAVAAMSFHWVDPGVGHAKVREALRPDGWWATWWTVFFDDRDPDPFNDATSPLLQPLRHGPSAGTDGRPYSLDFDLRRAELDDAGFVDIEVEVIPWTVTFSAARIRALYGTFSEIAARPEGERERILDAIAAIADERFGGEVERRFQTALYTCRR